MARKSTPKEFALENDTAKDHNTLAKQSSEDTYSVQGTERSATKERLGSDASSSSAGTSSSEESVFSVTKAEKEAYKQHLIQTMRATLPKSGANKGRVLKTLVISHADTDHYNLIPQVFPAQEEGSDDRIEYMVISGFRDEYLHSFQKWLDWAQKHIIDPANIIFTGTDDPSGLKSAAPARSYFTGMPVTVKTENEQKIEEALRFHGVPAGEGFQILAMNPTHTSDMDETPPVRLNHEKNKTSMVLRLRYGGDSIIFPGDAEEETWNRVFSNFHNQDLKSTYLLLSHHGSRANGATSARVIDVIQPEACLISCGRNMGHEHSARDVLNDMRRSQRLLKTRAHHVSSFKYIGEDPETKKAIVHHRMGQAARAIFSTANHGHLRIQLGAREKKVHVHYTPEKVYPSFLSDTFFKDFTSREAEEVPSWEGGVEALLQTLRTICSDMPQSASICLWQKEIVRSASSQRADIKKTKLIPYTECNHDQVGVEGTWHILLRHEKGSAAVPFTHFSVLDPVENDDSEDEQTAAPRAVAQPLKKKMVAVPAPSAS